MAQDRAEASLHTASTSRATPTAKIGPHPAIISANILAYLFTSELGGALRGECGQAFAGVGAFGDTRQGLRLEL